MVRSSTRIRYTSNRIKDDNSINHPLAPVLFGEVDGLSSGTYATTLVFNGQSTTQRFVVSK